MLRNVRTCGEGEYTSDSRGDPRWKALAGVKGRPATGRARARGDPRARRPGSRFDELGLRILSLEQSRGASRSTWINCTNAVSSRARRREEQLSDHHRQKVTSLGPRPRQLHRRTRKVSDPTAVTSARDLGCGSSAGLPLHAARAIQHRSRDPYLRRSTQDPCEGN